MWIDALDKHWIPLDNTPSPFLGLVFGLSVTYSDSQKHLRSLRVSWVGLSAVDAGFNSQQQPPAATNSILPLKQPSHPINQLKQSSHPINQLKPPSHPINTLIIQRKNTISVIIHLQKTASLSDSFVLSEETQIAAHCSTQCDTTDSCLPRSVNKLNEN